MRIKVESVPPLPNVKAWFSVHSATTVLELKSVLCADLPALQDVHITGQDVVLVLDDFELLDLSPIDVVRDGDLIVIKRHPSVPSNKRKAGNDEGSPARKRTKRSDLATALVPRASSQRSQQIVKPIARPASESSSGSGSDSESSSDSDTDSHDSHSESEDSSSNTSSEESSDSESSSESSTSSAPSSRPVRHVKTNGQASKPSTSTKSPPPPKKDGDRSGKLQTASVVPLVPPGLGKPTTHSRNVRRRRKRMYERLAATAEPASVNDIPLGPRPRTTESSPFPLAKSPVLPTESEEQSSVPPVIMMASLQNKNKRKGFKKAMTTGVPAKIVFSTGDDDAENEPQAVDKTLQEALPFTFTEDSSVLMANTRLVPPSEKQEQGLLPPNMFVTSVDVEEGLHTKKKKKRQQGRVQHADHDEYMEEDHELPYDDPADKVATSTGSNWLISSSHISVSIDREAISAKWSTLAKVDAPSQLINGGIVAWKELGINPKTLSPEMLVSIGRVVSCTEKLIVEPVLEDSPVEISFGGLISTDDAESSEQVYEWNDVLQGDWRIVP